MPSRIVRASGTTAGSSRTAIHQPASRLLFRILRRAHQAEEAGGGHAPRSVSAPDPIAEIAGERERARAAGDPLVDVCILATSDGSSAPGARALVLRDVEIGRASCRERV